MERSLGPRVVAATSASRGLLMSAARAGQSGWCDVWLDPAFRAWTIEREAEGISAPVQLIQGSDHPYGSLEQIDRIEARVRGPVERVVLPGGHSPHLEHTDAVVAAVAGFARRLG